MLHSEKTSYPSKMGSGIQALQMPNNENKLKTVLDTEFSHFHTIFKKEETIPACKKIIHIFVFSLTQLRLQRKYPIYGFFFNTTVFLRK